MKAKIVKESLESFLNESMDNKNFEFFYLGINFYPIDVAKIEYPSTADYKVIYEGIPENPNSFYFFVDAYQNNDYKFYNDLIGNIDDGMLTIGVDENLDIKDAEIIDIDESNQKIKVELILFYPSEL
ncbi:MAG: hypothetical protein ACOC1O_00760 [bacterium]